MKITVTYGRKLTSISWIVHCSLKKRKNKKLNPINLQNIITTGRQLNIWMYDYTVLQKNVEINMCIWIQIQTVYKVLKKLYDNCLLSITSLIVKFKLFYGQSRSYKHHRLSFEFKKKKNFFYPILSMLSIFISVLTIYLQDCGIVPTVWYFSTRLQIYSDSDFCCSCCMSLYAKFISSYHIDLNIIRAM